MKMKLVTVFDYHPKQNTTYLRNDDCMEKKTAVYNKSKIQIVLQQLIDGTLGKKLRKKSKRFPFESPKG